MMTATLSRTHSFGAFETSHIWRGLPRFMPCAHPHRHTMCVNLTVAVSADDPRSATTLIDYSTVAAIEEWTEITFHHSSLNEYVANGNPVDMAAYVYRHWYDQIPELTSVALTWPGPRGEAEAIYPERISRDGITG